MSWTSEMNELRKGEMALTPSFPFSKSSCSLFTSLLHSGWSQWTRGTQTFPTSVVLLCYVIGERASGKHFDKIQRTQPRRGQEFQILDLKTLKPYTNMRCLGCFPAFEIEYTKALHTLPVSLFYSLFQRVFCLFHAHSHTHRHTIH